MKINSEKNTRQFFNTGIYMHFQKLQRQGTKPTITGFTAAMPRGHTIRGGVEDTRLEAKDTKKFRGQGQGQPFRGQTLSRPRTGMLETKDTSASAPPPPKKRSPQKFFRRSPKKKGLHKNFSSDLPKKTFSIKFFKRST